MNNRDLASELIRIANLISKLAGMDGDLPSGDDYVPYHLAMIQFEKNSKDYILKQLSEAAAKGGWDLAHRFNELANDFGNSGYDLDLVPVLRDIINKWEQSGDRDDWNNYKEALDGLPDEVREVL